VIRPAGLPDELPTFKAGELITFIEGTSWVFVTKDGEEMKTPPLGIVLSTFDTYSVRVYWTTGEITMEWTSQIQTYSEFERKRSEKSIEGR